MTFRLRWSRRLQASMLLALAGTSLTVGLALLARTDLPGAAKVTGWLVIAMIATGVVLLATAIRPALGGNHGFVRYAAATSVDDLHSDLVKLDGERDRTESQITQLWWLSRAVQRKYRRVRLAVDLLMGGLVATIVTALLIVWS